MSASLVVFCVLIRINSAFLCSGCSRPYSFGSFTGVGACPSKYTLEDKSCVPQLDVTIIDSEFYKHTSFIASTIDVFSTNSGTFETIGNPFPTLDRGFYFPRKSYLKTTDNLIPSPSMSLEMWVRVLDYGDIISIDGDSQFLKIGYKANYFHIDYRYCDETNLCNLNGEIVTFDISNGVWISLNFDTIQNLENQLLISLLIYGDQQESISVLGENSISVSNPSEKYTWSVGYEQTGFKGFVYYYKVFNDYVRGIPSNINPPKCDPYYYFDQGNCVACSQCTAAGIWCVRSTDCSPCYNNFCDSCIGYTEDECTESSGQCSSGCLECTDYYNCSLCLKGYFKVEYDYGTVCKEDLQLSLLSSKLSTFIISGSNLDNDYTNDVEGDNPTPLPGRGYYFNGQKFLNILGSVFIPESFLIYAWIRAQNDGTILSKSDIFLMSSTHFQTSLKHEYYTVENFDLGYSISFNIWEYVAIELNCINPNVELKVTFGKNNNSIQSSGFFYNFLDDVVNVLLVGDGYIGFIAMLGIASKAFNPILFDASYMFSIPNIYGSQLNNCGFISNSSCSELCSNCDSCNNADYECLNCFFGYIIPNCQVPCSSCDICQDSLNSECFNCPFGYFHSSITCGNLFTDDGLINIDGKPYEDLGTCLFSPLGLGCSACNLNRVLYINICIKKCPSGFFKSSGKCSSLDYIVFVKDLSNLLETGNQENINFGSKNTDIYPEFDLNDPLPVIEKGYYFTANSSITVSDLIFGPEMSIGVWILIQEDGIIQNKGSGYQLFTNSYLGLSLSKDDLSLQVNYYNYAKSDNWVYISAKIWFDRGMYLTTVELILNKYVVKTETASLDYYYNDDSSDLMIGSESNAGFQGFIYYIEIYSTSNLKPDLFNKLNCGPSPLNDGCLDICEITEFNNENPKCLNCDISCTKGCLGSDDCELCTNTLCMSCLKYNSLECLTCKANFIMNSEGICKCYLPYVYDAETQTCILCTSNCKSCDQSCFLCYGQELEDCVTCKSGLYKIEGYCIACPSLSVTINNTECDIFLGEIFLATFDTFSGIIYDKLNSVPVITGNSEAFYPEYDSEDPIAAFKRGFYFNGNSSVLRLPKFSKWNSPKLILSINWTVEIWLNPKSDSGCFFSYIGPDSTLISLCFSNSKILVSTRSKFYLTNAFDIKENLDSWKVLMISFEFNGQITLSTLIDNIELSVVSNEDSIVPNYFSKSYFEIGKSNSEYFTGFIYQVSVFSTKPSYYDRSHSFCGGLLIDKCLVDCDIFEFYTGPDVNSCSLCHSSCSEGCIRSDSCSLCNDPLCYECSDFNSTVCDKCSSIELNGECGCAADTVLDYEVHECTVCGTRKFYNLFTCKDCSKFCSFCKDESICLECVKNALLDNDKCSCLLGYNGTVDCEKAEFEAHIITSEKNDIYIQFEDELLSIFDTSYISVSTSKISIKSIEIEQWTSTKYKLKLTYSSAIPKKTLLEIQFKKNIYSIYNSKLITQNLKAILQSDDSQISYQNLLDESEKLSASIVIILITIVAILSLAVKNPAFFWCFIGTIQMLSFISLSSLSLRPKFFGKLKGLLYYNPFPNIFTYFVPRTGGIKPFKRAYEYGYIDHLILFNISQIIAPFLTMIFLMIVTYILSKLAKYKPLSIEYIKKRINKAFADYKYGNFLRFWIVGYLDVFTSSLIGIITTSQFSTVGIINLTICIIFTIMTASSPLVFFYFTYMKKNQILDEKNEIHENWGTLFYEFDYHKGLSSILFYFFYFMRRIIYIIILLFLQDLPIVQVSLIFTLTACVFFYLTMFRPYKELTLNICNSLSEFVTTILFLILGIDQFGALSSFESKIDDILVQLLNSIMALHILPPVYVFFRISILAIKKRCNKNSSVLPQQVETHLDTNAQLKQKNQWFS